MEKKLLVVGEHECEADELKHILRDMCAVVWADSVPTAIGKLKTTQNLFDAVFSAWNVRGECGMNILLFCQTLYPPLPCVFASGNADVSSAVSAMKAGAADFLSTPLDPLMLRQTLGQIFQKRDLRGIGSSSWAPPVIIGNSAALQRATNLARRVAATNASVLLTGETGVGKDLFAQEIHRLSARANKPFLALNAAALPTEMVESQLFGHERGAFTDARQRHIGYFERANGGTLFLDEIGELPQATQIKLLRVLEAKSFERLGGDITISVDVRIITATNANLDLLVQQGIFREDLFYRVNVVAIAIPPLRERAEDIPELIDFFWRTHLRAPRLGGDTLAVLQRYSWPGNVRQLRNFCDTTAALYPGETLNLRRLENYFIPKVVSKADPIPLPERCLSTTQNVHEILNQCGGNRSRAAEFLGISRSTFYRRLKNMWSQSND
ncbi:MAG: sigma-54 dependent transcriptional regulator [Puniceicoccales bacterium]|jgi:DNA-binding NtrC family response regulator|nr:sigma-54 dependent transcriptional regulator [Puniceicoccales bacterium]